MKEIIDGKGVHIFQNSEGGPVIYWGISSEMRESAERTAEILKTFTGTGPWTVAAFESHDWNGDFSPWEANVSGNMRFSGNGSKTLEWLCESMMPWADKRFGMGRNFICGYSLAGLFSLWAMYESRRFNGAVSCSGSLWLPGWCEYAAEKTAPVESIIYLSLGNKEPRTRNKAMSEVGNETINQFERLKADPNVKKCKLVWESGGHFTEPEKRVASGIKWVLENL